MIQATEVFTPNDFPTHTYIQRQGENLEDQLRDALRTPKIVTSLSGPSKSGKTVLVERMVSGDLIPISGVEIKSVDDLWNRILDHLDRPTTTTTQATTTEVDTEGNQVSGGISIPVLGASIGGQRSLQTSSTGARMSSETRGRGAMLQVQDAIGDTGVVVFIDDFHYIGSTLQIEIARQIKAGSERGIRFAVAVVPHRSDDIVRNLSELRGRVRHIDTEYWPVDDLKHIALAGFPKLNMIITDAMAVRLAREACGSPQLMQQICLQICFKTNCLQTQETPVPIPSDAPFMAQLLEQSALTTDHSSLVRALHAGPRARGIERTRYQFIDKSRGDVYRAVLLAIAQPPPKLDISYAELMQRVNKISVGFAPPSQSVTQACNQIAAIAKDRHSNERIIEWDNATLSIADPYLLFYLRGSQKLAQLGASTIT